MAGLENSLSRYFNPRSRKGSDVAVREISQSIKEISIHAPARGATPRGISPHVPPSDFNPRSRKGSDDLPAGKQCSQAISIHAPARGATQDKAAFWIQFPFQSTLPQGERHLTRIHTQHTLYFNPRSRKGSDVLPSVSINNGSGFQSTLPQGERPSGTRLSPE